MRGPQQRAGSDMMRAALMHVCMHIYAYVIILCFLAALDSTSFQVQAKSHSNEVPFCIGIARWSSHLQLGPWASCFQVSLIKSVTWVGMQTCWDEH